MSQDPKDEALEEALVALRRAAESGAAKPGDLQSILDDLELRLDDLPVLPELPSALADEDWDAPFDDDPPPMTREVTGGAIPRARVPHRATRGPVGLAGRPSTAVAWPHWSARPSRSDARC